MNSSDRQIIRDLARRVAEVSSWPVMAERRERWRRHNALERGRPLIYVDPQGAWCELLPQSALRCREDGARWIEWQLRSRIYTAEHFASDNVIEGEWVVRKVIRNSGWGLEPRRVSSDTDRGAFGFQPVLLTPADLKKLCYPEVVHDAEATRQQYEFYRELFGDILDVRLKGLDDLSYHLFYEYTALRGLQEALVDMLDNPQMVHDAMAFFEEGHRRLLRQYLAQDLLALNNDNTAIYTSGHGYTDRLPRPGHDPARVRPEDLWGWAEAQELAVVSPEMHAEFAFPYEKRLLAPFGLNGYGCCDDVTRKLDFVLTLPNLRRVAVSPWADVEHCAERLRGNVILMWKPQPAHLVGAFDRQRIAAYLRGAVAAARRHGCVLEIVLLDTHTCGNCPEKFDEWIRIACQAVS